MYSTMPSNDGQSEQNEAMTKAIYANRHVPKFLSLPEVDRSDVIQVISDGTTVTAERLLKHDDLVLTRPMLVLDSPESIGMKVLQFPKRDVSVRDVADIIGHQYPVHVIDVEHQEELEGWTLTDLVDYFEDEERLFLLHYQKEMSANLDPQQQQPRNNQRRRRKAAERCLTQTSINRPRVLNQISLEFSKTPFSTKVLSPKFVRDLDWIDHAWPRPPRKRLSEPEVEYPNVQYYCLTSASGSYTDFHVDFGGTAVWYHVLNGRKTFCLIPPTKKNLKVYEEWLCHPKQADLFLPDLIEDPADVIRISLKASQTLVIPTAWIHAVYTPVDSLVIGGNFLHGLDISLQLQVHCIETRTRVQEKFRFPFFLPLNFYAGGMYLGKLRAGTIHQRELEGLPDMIHALQEWWKVQHAHSQVKTGPTVASAAQHAAETNQCASVDAFLDELDKEYNRVLQDGIVPNPNISIAPPTTKPKLHLKLPTTADPVPSVSADDGKFRIVVSSSAVKVNALPVVRPKKMREDTEWFVDEKADVDDEWIPSKRKKLGLTGRQKRKSEDLGAPMSSQSTKIKKSPDALKAQRGVKHAKPSQKKATTSRQRLMKRFR